MIEKCPEDQCAVCPDKNSCSLREILNDIGTASNQKFQLAFSPKDSEMFNFSSVDAVATKLLQQLDDMYNLWNLLNGWQVVPPNASREGLAWKIRSMLFLRNVEFKGKNELIIRRAFSNIAHVIYQSVHEQCSDGTMCAQCVITRRCPLEAQFTR